MELRLVSKRFLKLHIRKIRQTPEWMDIVFLQLEKHKRHHHKILNLKRF